MYKENLTYRCASTNICTKATITKYPDGTIKKSKNFKHEEKCLERQNKEREVESKLNDKDN